MSMTRMISGLAGMIVLGGVAVFGQSDVGQESKAESGQPAAPSHRVVAAYFHRTVRCPTCKKISATIDESIKAGYAQELKDGRVQFTMIDFQDPKNAQFTNYYRIGGPTLVIMDVRDNKVKSWKPAPQVWALVARPDAFYKYVQDEVRAYLEAK